MKRVAVRTAKRWRTTIEGRFGDDGWVRLTMTEGMHRWNTVVAPDGLLSTREAAAVLGITRQGVDVAARADVPRLIYGPLVNGMRTITVASVRTLHDAYRS